jgi:hypothetical protein
MKMGWEEIDIDAQKLDERREMFRNVLKWPQHSEVTIPATLAWEMVLLLGHIIDEIGEEE